MLSLVSSAENLYSSGRVEFGALIEGNNDLCFAFFGVNLGMDTSSASIKILKPLAEPRELRSSSSSEKTLSLSDISQSIGISDLNIDLKGIFQRTAVPSFVLIHQDGIDPAGPNNHLQKCWHT